MSYSDDKIQEVWEKATVVSNDYKNEWRKDQCEAWINRKHYGNRNSDYGWEVDHITPQSKGGGDEISNLRPLQWKNNASKQEDRLVCVVTSEGNRNVEKK